MSTLVAILWILGGVGTVVLFTGLSLKLSIVVKVAMCVPVGAYIWGGDATQELKWYYVLLFAAVIGDALLRRKKTSTPHAGTRA